MEKYVLQLQEVTSETGYIDTWVYRKLFDTFEEANEMGIRFSKEYEKLMDKHQYKFIYDETTLYALGEDNNQAFVSSYEVFTVDSEYEEVFDE